MATSEKRRSAFPVYMMLLGIALIIGSLVWLVISARSVAGRNESAIETTPRIPYPDVGRVSLSDANTAFKAGSAIFIDVRGDPYYSQGHIPGALSITEDELQSRLGELDPAKWVITYCT